MSSTIFISYWVGRCYHQIRLSTDNTLIKARSRFFSSSEIDETLGAAGIPKYFFVSSNSIIS